MGTKTTTRKLARSGIQSFGPLIDPWGVREGGIIC